MAHKKAQSLFVLSLSFLEEFISLKPPIIQLFIHKILSNSIAQPRKRLQQLLLAKIAL